MGNGKFNENKTRMNSYLLHQFEDKTCKGLEFDAVGWVFEVLERERESSFSLDFRPFGPSVLDGARSKVDLRD